MPTYRLQRLSQQNNFLYLLLSLLSILFTGALSGAFPSTLGNDLFSIVMLGALVVGIKSIHLEIDYRRILYLLIFSSGLMTVLWRLYPSSWSAVVILIMLFFSFLTAFKLAVHQILFEGRVDMNKVIGSLSLYLLIGLTWTILYLIILIFDPDAFKGIEGVHLQEWRETFSQVAYYSFITLTGLGYGDIFPINHIARFVVYLESIVGVFYMAIFVSSLINLAHSEQGNQHVDLPSFFHGLKDEGSLEGEDASPPSSRSKE